ncbi:MAG TPA: orotidine-5'-phosphate decarboxylase, partial [Acidimicrobiia bacterium]
VTARARAQALAPWYGVAKVGYELWAGVGPAALDALHEDGFAVFVDLKLFDIPTTVERAARVLGRSGADFVNFHAVGGLEMLRAGVAGLADGARDGGHTAARALAVTVLTSEADGSAVDKRLGVARSAGCDGVVCATAEAAAARALHLAPMVPGIRLAGSAANDQARVATPHDAIHAGAEWIIVGRSVTAADDPTRAAARLAAEVDAALHETGAPGHHRDR